jgi:hypothetical protein
MTTVFNMQADIVGTWVSSITASGTITLNAIPRQAQITSANNFNDEQNPSFTFSNAGGFTMSAYLSFAGKIIFRSGIGNATSGTYTFTLTEAERTTLRNATPNSNTMTVTYGLQTTISGTVYSHTIAKTMTVVNANPTAPTLDYFDIEPTSASVTGDQKRIIQNQSSFRAVVGTSTAKKGATIKSYSVSINGVTKAGNGNIDFGLINSATNTDLVVTVTDSRGLTATTKKTVIVDSWEQPTAITTLYRVNNYESESRLKVDCTYSSLNGKNKVTCQYCYKKTTDTTFSNWSSISDKTLLNITLDNLYDYNFKVRINDVFSGYISEYNLILPKGIPIVFIDTEKKSVGIGKFPTLDNSLEGQGYGHFAGGLGTNGDLTVIGNIKLSGVALFDSGSNERGTYIKFADGTMICAKRLNIQTTCSNAWGSMFDSPEITIGEFPVNFNAVPIVTAISTGANSCFIEGVRDTTTSTWGKMWICRPVSTNSVWYTVDLIAVGRWK